MSRVHRLLALLLCLFSASAWGYPHQLTCKSTLYEPFVIKDSAGIRGIDVDVVREMGRRLGVRIKISLMPWRRLEERLREGKEDCVFAYFNTPKRHRYALYMGVPLHITRYALFGKIGLVKQIHDIADLKGLKIGVNLGFQVPKAIASGAKSGLFQLIEVRDETLSFRMLALGRLDLVLTNSEVGDYVSHHLLHLAVDQARPPLTIRPAYLVLANRPALKPLLERFNDVLWQILTDGTYRKICEKYISDCDQHW